MAAALVAVALATPPVGAAAGGRSSTERLRRQQVRGLLRRLNKAPLASIQSPDGDIIDCVHISKQPAFDHPLLKNHTIQMRPSYYPGGKYNGSKDEPHPITQTSLQTWHQNSKCPDNTIPIRRIKDEDILRASSIRKYGKKRPSYIPNLTTADPDTPSVLIGHQHAVASARNANNHYGTKASFNLWQPEIERKDDFSLTQLWVTSGSYTDEDLNTVEAGWQVYPGMYGDNNPRLFIYWTRDAYSETGCYNLVCPGFVQINNQIAIGGSLSPVSIYGGSQYDIDILVCKDPKGGNWWLQVGGSDVGYWPSSIFSGFTNGASSIQWGGEVFSPDAGQTSTQMGSGHFPHEGFGKASHIKNIQVVDSSNSLQPPSGVDLITEQSNCYNVQVGGANSNWGTYIYYGGPGKNPNCQ
ncbi:hypothetical protein HU200_066240 [Digitaria exilis]|uniref:Neprosin PEP catalytic domain-containing protein n=1 Tax=Digitaria exilis TaxID=1010633 RepID=A0A835A823_9POAL|nr:hypothetical protein HU200_066240 [Digitaria exilis]